MGNQQLNRLLPLRTEVVMNKKEVDGYPNYEIYDDGRLWSRNYNRFLIPFKNSQHKKKYYLAYKLCREGTEKTMSAHRLVAQAFIPNPDNLPVVNHKDGNTINNVVDNLEWVTHRQNVQHAYDTNLIVVTWIGEDHPRSTYTTDQVEEICRMFASGIKPKDIVKSTTLEYQKLFRIYNRDNWKEISNKYFW